MIPGFGINVTDICLCSDYLDVEKAISSHRWLLAIHTPMLTNVCGSVRNICIVSAANLLEF